MIHPPTAIGKQDHYYATFGKTQYPSGVPSNFTAPRRAHFVLLVSSNNHQQYAISMWWPAPRRV